MQRVYKHKSIVHLLVIFVLAAFVTPHDHNSHAHDHSTATNNVVATEHHDGDHSHESLADKSFVDYMAGHEHSDKNLHTVLALPSNTTIRPLASLERPLFFGLSSVATLEDILYAQPMWYGAATSKFHNYPRAPYLGRSPPFGLLFVLCILYHNLNYYTLNISHHCKINWNYTYHKILLQKNYINILMVF